MRVATLAKRHVPARVNFPYCFTQVRDSAHRVALEVAGAFKVGCALKALTFGAVEEYDQLKLTTPLCSANLQRGTIFPVRRTALHR